MKKRKLFISITIVTVILFSFGLLFCYSRTVDTEYAIKYSEVFGSYNIDKVDKYLKENTQISYQGKTKTYKELRKNLVEAFNEKKYIMPQKSSYGHGDDKFVNNIQEVWVLTFVEYKNKLSEDVLMEIERKGLFSYSIRSIKGDGSFFGYLFFGIEE